MSHSLNTLYRLVGLSKQAVHQHRIRQFLFAQQLSELIHLVDILRSEHPGCGVEKMYYTLRPNLIGRDKFITIFMGLGYALKPRKNYVKTTYSVQNEFTNLIEGLLVTHINQLVQSDISFYRVGEHFYYLIFIIDVYSKRILAFQASDHMRASANRKALQQMIRLRGKETLQNCIHHSDRGSQYNEKKYLAMLRDMKCHISMGIKGQDNAYAERINGIIKNEYLKYWTIKDLPMLRTKLKQAVDHYNSSRPHNHLPNRYSPIQFENVLLEGKLNIPHFELIYAQKNYQKRPVKVNLDFSSKYKRGYFCPLFDNYFSNN